MTTSELEYIKAEVRRKSSRDVLELPDEDLGEMIAASRNTIVGVFDFYGVVADAWEFLSTNDRYLSRQVGNLAVGRPLAPVQASYYRSISIGGGGGRGNIVVGTLARDDRGFPDYDVTAGEHSHA
jgi:hypothetical protein